MKRIFLILSLLFAPAWAQAQSVSVWYPNAITYVLHTPSQSYTVGTEIKFLHNGFITGFSFPKAPTDPTTSRNTVLWSTAGANLAECTTTNEPTGTEQWVTCMLATPFQVSAPATYIVSYDLPMHTNGQVQDPNGICTQTGNAADFTCLADVYSPGLTVFPATTSTGATFFADIIFTLCP